MAKIKEATVQGNEVAKVQKNEVAKSIFNKLPDGMTVRMGDEKPIDGDYNTLMQQFVRNKVFKAYGIKEYKGLKTTSKEMLFNDIMSGLRLPKPKVFAGTNRFSEKHVDFLKRITPLCEDWYNNSITNALYSVATEKVVM